jgi:hypothetical protein
METRLITAIMSQSIEVDSGYWNEVNLLLSWSGISKKILKDFFSLLIPQKNCAVG